MRVWLARFSLDSVDTLETRHQLLSMRMLHAKAYMSECEVQVMNDTAPDVDADGVEDEFCQLHIGHM